MNGSVRAHVETKRSLVNWCRHAECSIVAGRVVRCSGGWYPGNGWYDPSVVGMVHLRVHCPALFPTVRHCFLLSGTVSYCPALFPTVWHGVPVSGMVSPCLAWCPGVGQCCPGVGQCCPGVGQCCPGVGQCCHSCVISGVTVVSSVVPRQNSHSFLV